MNRSIPSEPKGSDYFLRTECPCCGALASRSQLAVASDPPAENLPFSEHSQFASGYTSQRVFFSYFRCLDCTALYCRTFYAPNQLEALYSRQAENMGGVSLDARQRTQKRYAQFLMKYSPRGGDFLEIGADIGLFAEECAASGDFGSLLLYEPNYAVHSELAARLKEHRHVVHATMAPAEDAAPESISTAAMIHVLDHLLDPLSFLVALRSKLSADAAFLIVTHNTASPLAKILDRRWPPFALQHPQLYSPRSITTLLERAGFSVQEIAGAVNYFPLMHLLRAAMAIVGMRNVFLNAQGPTIPIKLGNIAVVARKPAH